MQIANITGASPGVASLRPVAGQLALALAYGGAGYPVSPASPDTKRPLCPHGFHDATRDEEQIREWWSKHPDALVSIPTGERTGLVVLDVDGPQGRASLAELLAKLGVETIGDLTPVICRTPSGGLHLYFRFEEGTTPRTRASDIAAGLDTRAIGGSIIVPGNTLPDGRRYELIDPASLVECCA
jgi:hypothetical protein